MSVETNTKALPDLHQRAWQNLTTRRLALGLIAAPVPSVILGGVMNAFAWTDLWNPVVPFLWAVVAAEIWSIAFGIFYLLTASRPSGTITCANCIFIGGLAAILFPPMLTLLYAGIVGAALVALAVMTLPFSILAGMFLTPLGVLGGWVFWLVGVRPAQLPVSGIEQVFE